jgi:uncharacterized membrane protein required for colicin V production
MVLGMELVMVLVMIGKVLGMVLGMIGKVLGMVLGMIGKVLGMILGMILGITLGMIIFKYLWHYLLLSNTSGITSYCLIPLALPPIVEY